MPQQLPPASNGWLFSPNNRISFVSLNDTMARLLFGIKNFLVATAGYTVKYTSTGSTGPSSASDHTDRWLSFSNCATRGTAAGTNQSFAVLTDGNGCDLLLTYQGASDDIARISFSPSGLFVPAGTSTQQPTATDELVVLTGTSLVGGTASLDRVWHAMATKDRRSLRFFIYRAGSLMNSVGLELCLTNGVIDNGVSFNPPVVGWATSQATINAAPSNGSVVGPGTTNNGGIARINSTSVAVGGCGESYLGSLVGTSLTLDLQGGGPVVVPVGFATSTASVAGKIGNRIDCWFGYWTGVPQQGDALGDLTHVFFGTGIHPWDGVSYPVVA